MDVGVVQMTTKGQLVIPHEMRESLDVKEGDKLLVFQNDDSLVLRPLKKVKKNLVEELYHLQKVQEGWASLQRGEGEMWKNFEEFAKWLRS